MKIQTLKGFRDFLPEQANTREFVVGKIKQTFKSFGFEPLETPALEYTEVLKGKYGEEEKLIYKFTTKGGDEVALRYDQTVPLARVIAEYPQLPKPFKRYQIQPVWRGENTQKGRYRELTHCDIDTIGSNSPLADAEIISCALATVKNLGLKSAYMEINDRNIFQSLEPKYISAIDKLKKIGQDGVVAELQQKGMSKTQAEEILNKLTTQEKTPVLQEIFAALLQMGLKEGQDFKFIPTLARGLDYYTGPIFELVSPEYGNLSLGGGGRFDKLVGIYAGIDSPATGFAFGFDRLVEALTELNLLPATRTSTTILVTIFSPDLTNKSLEISSYLRSNNVNTELWLDPENKLEKQLKYADQKGIPYVIIIGPEEINQNKVVLKNLSSKKQQTLTLDEVVSELSS